MSSEASVKVYVLQCYLLFILLYIHTLEHIDKTEKKNLNKPILQKQHTKAMFNQP